jgi:hypothetical protein
VRRRGGCLRADAYVPLCVPPRPCAGRSAAPVLHGSQRPPEHTSAHISGAQHFAALALLPGARAHGGGAVVLWPLRAAAGAPFWRAPGCLEGGAAQRFWLRMPPGSPRPSLQCCSRVAATVGKQDRLTRACCACATPPSVRARRRKTGPKALALMAAQHARHARNAAAAACKNVRTRIYRCVPVRRRSRRARIPKSGLTRRPPYTERLGVARPARLAQPAATQRVAAVRSLRCTRARLPRLVSAWREAARPRRFRLPRRCARRPAQLPRCRRGQHAADAAGDGTARARRARCRCSSPATRRPTGCTCARLWPPPRRARRRRRARTSRWTRFTPRPRCGCLALRRARHLGSRERRCDADCAGALAASAARRGRRAAWLSRSPPSARSSRSPAPPRASPRPARAT